MGACTSVESKDIICEPKKPRYYFDESKKEFVLADQRFPIENMTTYTIEFKETNTYHRVILITFKYKIQNITFNLHFRDLIYCSSILEPLNELKLLIVRNIIRHQTNLQSPNSNKNSQNIHKPSCNNEPSKQIPNLYIPVIPNNITNQYTPVISPSCPDK